MNNITLKYVPKSLAYRVFLRFARVFGSGFLGSLVIMTATVPSLATLTELKVWLLSLAVAGLSGGIAASDKAYRK